MGLKESFTRLKQVNPKQAWEDGVRGTIREYPILKKIPPDLLTLFAIKFGVDAAEELRKGNYGKALLKFVASGVFDILDGPAARESDEGSTQRGAYLDTRGDRYVDKKVQEAFIDLAQEEDWPEAEVFGEIGRLAVIVPWLRALAGREKVKVKKHSPGAREWRVGAQLVTVGLLAVTPKKYHRAIAGIGLGATDVLAGVALYERVSALQDPKNEDSTSITDPIIVETKRHNAFETFGKGVAQELGIWAFGLSADTRGQGLHAAFAQTKAEELSGIRNKGREFDLVTTAVATLGFLGLTRGAEMVQNAHTLYQAGKGIHQSIQADRLQKESANNVA